MLAVLVLLASAMTIGTGLQPPESLAVVRSKNEIAQPPVDADQAKADAEWQKDYDERVDDCVCSFSLNRSGGQMVRLGAGYRRQRQ